MENNAVKNNFQSKRSRKSTPTKLVDGTLCYTMAVRYPKDIMDALRLLCYEKNFSNMSETVFYCIEEHLKRNLLVSDTRKFCKKDATPLTIRFREKHYDYINKVCAKKELKTYSNSILHIVFEFLKVEERI